VPWTDASKTAPKPGAVMGLQLPAKQGQAKRLAKLQPKNQDEHSDSTLAALSTPLPDAFALAPAPLGAATARKYTTLHYAAAECDKEVVLMLLASTPSALQTDLNRQDRCGNTPLHWAASVGSTDVVKVLLQCGAESETKNYMGLTPLEWAEKRNRTRIRDQQEELARIRDRELVKPIKSSDTKINSSDAKALLARSHGSCADKISMVDVLETVDYLKKRVEALEGAAGVVRLRRNMHHAMRKGLNLESFARDLTFADIDTLTMIQSQHGVKNPIKRIPKRLLLENNVIEPPHQNKTKVSNPWNAIENAPVVSEDGDYEEEEMWCITSGKGSNKQEWTNDSMGGSRTKQSAFLTQSMSAPAFGQA